jgi:predicted RNA-binding protein with RPS1 domain
MDQPQNTDQTTERAPEDASLLDAAGDTSAAPETPEVVQASSDAGSETASAPDEDVAAPDPSGATVDDSSPAAESAPEAVPAPSTTDVTAADPVAADSAAASTSESAPADDTAAADAAPPAQAAPPRKQLSPEENEARRQRAQANWDHVVAAKESNEVLNGTVTAAVKGGLLIDVNGIRGFLPASQVRAGKDVPIESLIKTTVPIKVIDVDTTRRRIVVSHRRAVEGERRVQRKELLASLKVGETREGTVVRLTDFGAFVDLGGVDGLIPMRELAFERVDKTADVVSVGEKLMVEVLRVDEGGKKISLSRRNALPDPWREHGALLKQGNTVEGHVVAKDPRLEIEIAPGVIGAVRENDANPADYEIGENVEVVIRYLDRRTRRITLSTVYGAAAYAAQPTTSGFAPIGIEFAQSPKPKNK